MWWLHTDAGYSFNGDAPIAGLTPREVDTLLLGHLVRQEQEDEAASGGSGNESMRRQKREIEKGQQKARGDILRDLGIQ